MPSSKSYLQFVLDQLSGLGEIRARAMMGEYLLYYRGKYVAAICDDRLLVKPVEAARALMPEAAFEPPYAGAKEMLLVEAVDDPAFLAKLFAALYEALPAPKKTK